MKPKPKRYKALRAICISSGRPDAVVRHSRIAACGLESREQTEYRAFGRFRTEFSSSKEHAILAED